MPALSLIGYRLDRRLLTTAETSAFTGVRSSDERPVILKQYAADRGRRPDRTHASRELAMLLRLDAPGVVRPLGLELEDDRAVLVLERPPGVPVGELQRTSGVLDLETCIRIGLGIAGALEAVHGARIVYGNVDPATVLVDRDTLEVCLVDFGGASDVGAPRRAAPRLSPNMLQYVAPEQTGRVAAGVDCRADLYSLGAVLYQLFAGHPPFARKGSVDLIHAHLCVAPRPLCEVRPDVPQVLSDVVMRLLAKDPDSRYQSAHGVRVDLERCWQCLASDGTLTAAFELGADDASGRLRVPHCAFGRAREVAALASALERVRRGGIEVVVISGPPGSGKSALADTLRGSVRESGGYLAHGQIDGAGLERPYSALQAAFGSLCDQLLAERSDRFELWRDRIGRAVSPIGAALLGILPDLALIVRDLPAVPQLGSRESFERLSLAAGRFVNAVAPVGEPLVLVLDDLDQADAPSLKLLEAIVTNVEAVSLLVVATVQAQAGPSGAAVRGMLARLRRAVPVQEVVVESLTVEATAELLAATLGRSEADARRLAEIVALKTDNNPQRIRQLLEILVQRGALAYVHGLGWECDESTLAGIDVDGCAAEYARRKLDVLPGRAVEILKIASVMSDPFDAETIAAVSHRDYPHVLETLADLASQGMLCICRDGFRFTHERVRASVLEQISSTDVERLHYDAAFALLERTELEHLDERTFEVADHLNRARDRLEKQDRAVAAQVNARAGARALAEGAAGIAARYFDAAVRALSDEEWEQRPETLFDLYLGFAESLLQAGEVERGLEQLDLLDARGGWDVVRCAQIAAKRIAGYALRDGPDRIVEATFGILRRFGIRLPERPSLLRALASVIWTDLSLRGRLHPRSVRRARREDDDVRIARDIVLFASGSILASGDSHCYMISRGIRLRAHVAQSRPAPERVALLLAGYAPARLKYPLGKRLAKRYADAAHAWLEDASPAPEAWIGRFVLFGFWYPLEKGHRGVVAPLAGVVSRLEELGEVAYSTYAGFIRSVHVVLGGGSLGEAIAELTHIARRSGEREIVGARWLVRSLCLLSGDSTASDTPAESAHVPSRPAELASEAELEAVHEGIIGRSWGRWGTGAVWMMTLATLGRFDRIVEWHRNGPLDRSFPAFLHDETFYAAVAACAVAARRSGRQRAALRRTAAQGLRVIERYARANGAISYLADALRAELAALDGHAPQALELYRRAATTALAERHPHHAAFLYERRSHLLSQERRPREAAHDLEHAAALYEAWGAVAKARHLRGA